MVRDIDAIREPKVNIDYIDFTCSIERECLAKEKASARKVLEATCPVFRPPIHYFHRIPEATLSSFRALDFNTSCLGELYLHPPTRCIANFLSFEIPPSSSFFHCSGIIHSHPVLRRTNFPPPYPMHFPSESYPFAPFSPR